MRSSIVIALAVSLFVHGLLALAFVAYLEFGPEPDVLATLDLSSVELSFAEKTEETAAAMPMPATPPARPQAQPKAERAPAPAPEKTRTTSPDPATPKLREPTEAPRKLESLPAPRKLESLPAPRQARVDAPPKPKRTIRPDYPKGARQRGEQGDVTLEIRVNAEGTVDAVKVVVSSGFPELDAAAAKAAKAAKFAPAKSGREPVASTARLKLSFKLK